MYPVYDFGHGGPGFPVWHRYYLMWYEREIRWMLGGNKEFAIPFWDWTAESNRMHPFKEELFGASDEKGNVIGNFANWTVICEVDLDHICDPTQTTSRMMRFGTPEVYVANYTKWPTREQVCEAISIPVYDIPPYDPTSISLRSFRNFMEGFYFRGDSEDAKECVESNVECSSDEIMKRQLHNEVLFLSMLSVC